MKINKITASLSLSAAAALLVYGTQSTLAVSAVAVPTVDTQWTASPFQTVEWETARQEKLRHAYYLIDHAKGDYEGHRLEAMHSIKKAADLAGVELHYEGRHEESQWKSDRQLTEAKTLLESLSDGTHAKEQVHISKAVKELDKALTVR